MATYINRAAFATLGIADCMRAYLALRSTPVPVSALERAVGHIAVSAYLDADSAVRATLALDLKAGHIMHSSMGRYFATRTGRVALQAKLPVEVFGTTETLVPAQHKAS